MNTDYFIVIKSKIGTIIEAQQVIADDFERAVLISSMAYKPLKMDIIRIKRMHPVDGSVHSEQEQIFANFELLDEMAKYLEINIETIE
jgi:hypothetical protein